MVNFWEENENEQSSTRLVFIVGSAWLMGVTTYLATKPETTPMELATFFTLIFAALAGSKLVQKGQEAKPDLPKDPNKVT